MGTQEKVPGELCHECHLSWARSSPGRASTAGNGTQESIACAEILENDLSTLLASAGAPITPTASLSQKDLTGKGTFVLGQLFPHRIFAPVKGTA